MGQYLYSHHKFKRAVASANLAACVLISGSCLASSDPIFDLSLEQLLQLQVVTAASGYEQPLVNAPMAVSVISKAEWEAAGALELNDVLPMVPGVYVGKSSAGVPNNKPVVRGISGNFGEQVLVLIDGHPIKYRQDSGRTAGDHLLLTGFTRIEVIRSPGSAIYGADAVGGVINLVTDKSMTNELTLRTGEFQTYGGALTHQKTFTDGAFRFALAHQRSNDDPDKIITHDLQTNFDRIFGTSASRAPGRMDDSYHVTQLNTLLDWRQFTVQAHLWRSENEGLGYGVASAIDPDGYFTSQNEQYNFYYQILDSTKQRLKLEITHNHQFTRTLLHVFPAGTQLPIGADGNVNFANPEGLVTFSDGYIGSPGNDNNANTIALTHTFEFGQHHLRSQIGIERQTYHANENKNFGPSVINGGESVVGSELTDVTNTPYIFIPDSKRELSYVSIEDKWRLSKNLSVTAGGRFDSYSDFGSTFNPRMGLHWQANSNTTLSWYGGSAFRAPSFVNLYSQNNPTAEGNPDLRPERIRTLEAGLNGYIQTSSNTNINFNLYRYTLTDMIEFTPQINSGIQLASNQGKQVGWGGELEGNWHLTETIRFKSHYAYLHSENKFGETTANIPAHMFYLQAHIRINKNWQFFSNTKWLSERSRAANDTREPLNAYALTSLRLAWIQPTYSIALSAKNLLGSDVREPSSTSLPNDIPLAGRQLMLEVKLTGW